MNSNSNSNGTATADQQQGIHNHGNTDLSGTISQDHHQRDQKQEPATMIAHPTALAETPTVTATTPLDPKEVAGTYPPEQQSPTLFTTTDASGYPDRQDGLSAYYSPPAVANVQDLHDHHKHYQVPLPASVPGDPHHHHHHHHDSNKSELPATADTAVVVDRNVVEVAEMVGDTRLPEQTVVAHFLR